MEAVTQATKISEQLAKFVLDQAVSEPYRQSDVMDTQRFAEWLRDRRVRLDWRILHYLAGVGVLHPIAVFSAEESGNNGERFIPHRLYAKATAYVDLGRDVLESDLGPPPSFDSLPMAARGSLLWHPFQLWEVEHVARRLNLPIALGASLADGPSYLRLVEQTHREIRASIAKIANSDEHTEFIKVLAVLLAVEALVITRISNKLRLNSWPLNEGLEGYFEWREEVDGRAILDRAEITIDTLVAWHRKLAITAQLNDPNERWRTLIRYAPREKRLRLKDKALMAEEFYYAAEILRRYLEQYHQRHDLLEEDDVIYGQQGPDVKQRMYGDKKTTNFDRSVFRQVVRQFDLDPQPRLRWLIEGETEQEFIYRLAELSRIDLHQWGVEVVSLHGLGGLDSERTRTLLSLSQGEEVFAAMAIDHDGIKKNPGILQTYAKQRLLPAGFKVFTPDFERANFAIEEMAAVANLIGTEKGLSESITAKMVSRKMQANGITARKVVFSLLNNCLNARDWGIALADQAFNHCAPSEVRNTGAEREIISMFKAQLRARTSNYKFTVEGSCVDDEGKVVSKG